MSLMDFASRIFIVAPERQQDEATHDLIQVLVFVWLMIIIGIVGILIPAAAYALQRHYVDSLITIGTGAFLTGAATAIGSLIGFLFGVPRASQRARRGPEGNTKGDALYLPNTNLEEISDWLTKIIVGVGLVEIREVVGWFGQIGAVVGPAIWNGPAGPVVATAILVSDLLMGFFQGFLVAYLYLPKAFASATNVVRTELGQQSDRQPTESSLRLSEG